LHGLKIGSNLRAEGFRPKVFNPARGSFRYRYKPMNTEPQIEASLNVRKRVSKYKSLPQLEKALIEEFFKARKKPIKESRKRKYRTDLGIILFELGKPASDVTKTDLVKYIEGKNSTNLSDWTKYNYREAIKAFFGFLKGKEFVEWIVLSTVTTTIDQSKMLDDGEISRMIEASTTLQEKAFTATLLELGVTPQEFLSLKKSNVRFVEFGAIVDVPSGKHLARPLRIFRSVPYLSNWIENHPLRQKDAPL
jgi:integrase